MDKTYWVLADGKERGPYALDSVIELVRRGAVEADTPIRIDGTETWDRADTLDEVRPHLPRSVPETAVMEQPPVARRTSFIARNLRWIIGLAIGLTIGTVASVGVVLFRARPFAAPVIPEPVLAEGLPSKIRTMLVVRLPERSSSEERGLAASTLATLCGGSDIGATLLSARGKTPADLEREGTLDLLRGRGVREALQCGERMASAAGGVHVVFMGFQDGEQSRGVTLVQLGELAQPPFSQRHNFGGLEGRCQPAEEGSAECAEEGDALVRRGDQWAFGAPADVAAYAHEWNRGAERSETTDMEYARLLGESLEDDAPITSVQVRPDALPFDVLCTTVPGGVSECLPDDVGDTLTRIRTAVRGVSVQVRTPVGAIVDPSLTWVIAFAARDEEDAEDVARDLSALLTDWRAHLENNEAVLIERIRASGERDVDQREAMLRAFVRAIRAAEVETDGRLARLVAQAELSDAEQREVAAYLATVREEREAASRVVLATIAGEAPARADLARLVGDPAAGWMLEPRASEARCTQIREHLEQLAAGGVPTADFGAHFRLQQAFAADRCPGTVMPPASLTCLVGATSIAAMETCARPRPPWERQPIDQTHRGELTDDDLRVDQDGSAYDVYTIEVDAGWTITLDHESTAFDPYLWLINPSGILVAQDDDGGEGNDSRIRFTAVEAGTYTIRANAYDATGRGAYTLHVVATPGAL